MKYLKSAFTYVIRYLQLITLNFLKFLSKLQAKVNNLDAKYYTDLKSSLEEEFSDSEAMNSLADKYEELKAKEEPSEGLKILASLNKELFYAKGNDIENLALKSSLEDLFNSGSKYSEIMSKICFIEKEAFRASDKLLSNELRDLFLYKDSEGKFGELTFDKKRRMVYLESGARRDEIREAVKKCKMFFASKFNEELERTESPIDDISCDVGIRDTDVATVTRGSY